MKGNTSRWRQTCSGKRALHRASALHIDGCSHTFHLFAASLLSSLLAAHSVHSVQLILTVYHCD